MKVNKQVMEGIDNRRFAPGVTIRFRMQSFFVKKIMKEVLYRYLAVVRKYPIDGWLDLKVSLISNILMCRCTAGACGRATIVLVLPQPL